MRWLALAGLLWAGAAARETLVDRIVAVVDEDPIFLSDVRRAIGLGLVSAAQGESERYLQRRVLDSLIEQRLRYHAVERYGSGPLPVVELDRQLGQVRADYPDAAAFEARLARLGMTEEDLRHLLARQLRVLGYVEDRLGPRVFVDLEDVRAYYEGELAAKAASDGMPLPPLEDLRDEIRALLREMRLNEEIAEWTEKLRLEARIVDLFDRTAEELPPVVRRFE